MSTSKNLFSDSNSIDSGIDDLQNPKFSYAGSLDEEGLRDRYGCQTWDQPFHHKYSGYFLYNNMHDKGFYFIRQEDGGCFYDGQMYNNKLEGYGQIIYKDGTVYEGLFKDNKKFGPGVLTYPDDTQDVGIWNGNYLMRLSISLTSEIVPSLCTNPGNRIKLLRYKKIVPALPERKDVAKDLMNHLTKDESMIQKYPQLYNPHVRNENSLFFDRRLYDLAQVGLEDAFIEVLEDEAFIDTNSDITDAEDAECPCMNERCVHLNEQLSELETELRYVHEMMKKCGEQLRVCGSCCKGSVHSSVRSYNPSSGSNSELGGQSMVKYPTRVTLEGDEDTRNTLLKTDGDNNPMVTDNMFIKEDMVFPVQTKISSINRLFVSANMFSSGLISSNNTDQYRGEGDISEKNICVCTDEGVPNIDNLLKQLEKLKAEERFLETVIEFLNRVIYKEFSEQHKSYSNKVTKVPVDGLLTWNNGKTITEILQHSFRYRNFESILNFSIKSVLTGERQAFSKMGDIEDTCINFLRHCASNKIDDLRKDLFYHNVYPDLADARGNTGLHLAVICNRREVIRLLANVGANLNVFNDECITPLILTLLRYISTLNKVVFWEKAFLSELTLDSNEVDQVAQWRPHDSLLSLAEFIEPFTNIPEGEQVLVKDSEEMSVRGRRKTQSIKSGSICAKINITYLFSTIFIEDYDGYKKALAAKKIEEVDEKVTENIAHTIETLVHYGADPNVGDLPMRPVLLSIFTKNLKIVEMLLKAGGYPNSVTEENLTALHILASQPFSSINVQMANKFLEYSSDPNLKTPEDFWMAQHEELQGSYMSSPDDTDGCGGKTPLFMIVMRKDFDEENVDHQCEFVKVLIEFGAVYDEYFLGHTLLSLAALRGNKKLIETLQNFVEVGQPLGENMGNALTVLCLERFHNILPFRKRKTVVDALVHAGMNPFNPVYDFSNIYEFFYYDHSTDLDLDNPKTRVQLEAADKYLRKFLRFRNFDTDTNGNHFLIEYLKDIGRDILMTLYQYEAMNILLLFASEDQLKHEPLDYMAQFFTMQKAIDCLKLHIQSNEVVLDVDFENRILKVLNFIKSKNLRFKQSNRVSQQMKFSPSDHDLGLEKEILKLKEKIEVPYDIVKYVLDSNQDKYEVCFHCLRISNRKLQPCPRCGLIKFCSKLCNKYNIKLDTNHQCNVLFYDDVGGRLGKPTTPLDLLLMEENKRREDMKVEEGLEKEKEQKEKFHTRHHTKSTSTSFIPIKKSNKKKFICCKKPSPVFICDEDAKFEQRDLNCGFHCGQVIPNVEIDEAGNIIRERDFCECYPLYNGKKPSRDLIKVNISKEEVEKENDESNRVEPDTSETKNSDDSDEDTLSEKIKEVKPEETEKELGNRYINPKFFDGNLDYHGTSKKYGTGGDFERSKPRKSGIKMGDIAKIRQSISEKNDALKSIRRSFKMEDNADLLLKGKDAQKGKKKDKIKPKRKEPVTSTDEESVKKKQKRKDRDIQDGNTLGKERHRKKSDRNRSEKDETERYKDVKKKGKKKLTEKQSEEDETERFKDVKKKGKKKLTEKRSEKDETERDKDLKKKGKKKISEKKSEKDEKGKYKDEKKKGKKKISEKKSEKYEKGKYKDGKIKGRKKRYVESEETSSKKSKSRHPKTPGKVSPSKKIEKASSRSKSAERQIDKSKKGLLSSKTVDALKTHDSTVSRPVKISSKDGKDQKEFKMLSRIDQYFLELMANYFPDFDMSCLMLPFACFNDGQLYYKFEDASPFYCRTYSTM